jgi:adenylate kinase
MTNLILFGKPGSGKGTQAEFIREKYNLIHISTGVLFRDHLNNKTPLGKIAKSYMGKGDLVPDKVTIKMLEEEVKKNPNANGFIFDGFPRTVMQAKALDVFLNSKKMNINAIIALEAKDSILIDRLLNRGLTSERNDDQDEVKIKNRFEEYNKKTAPLKDYYIDQRKFYDIDGIGPIKEVTIRLFDIIDDLK